MIYVVFVLLFGYIFVNFVGLGTFGIGLASSLAIAIATLFLYFWCKVTCKSAKFSISSISIKNVLLVFQYGSVVGLGYIFITMRSIAVNCIMQDLGGITAVAAEGVCISTCSFLEVIPIGMAESLVMIVSVFMGTQNKKKINNIFDFIKNKIPKIVIMYTILYSLSAFYFCMLLASDPEVRMLATEICLLCIPCEFFFVFSVLTVFLYLCFGKVKIAVVYKILSSSVVPLAAMVLLVPVFGVYASGVGPSLATMFCCVLYCVVSTIKNRRFPHTLYEFFWLDDCFENGLSIFEIVQNKTEVLEFSKKIEKNLEVIGVEKCKANELALSCEKIGLETFDNSCSEKRKKKMRCGIFCPVQRQKAEASGD